MVVVAVDRKAVDDPNDPWEGVFIAEHDNDAGGVPMADHDDIPKNSVMKRSPLETVYYIWRVR